MCVCFLFLLGFGSLGLRGLRGRFVLLLSFFFFSLLFLFFFFLARPVGRGCFGLFLFLFGSCVIVL